MHRKLTISIDEQVYKGLYVTVGERKISRFIENLVKPHVLQSEFEAAYREMAADEKRECEAVNWSEGIIEDLK